MNKREGLRRVREKEKEERGPTFICAMLQDVHVYMCCNCPMHLHPSCILLPPVHVILILAHLAHYISQHCKLIAYFAALHIYVDYEFCLFVYLSLY